ncbi:uncharacterized protein LOC119316012 [Triticum dicoccoides]|uniref:uncharacterized protein LOC119316012 n=1 Tax=Triticum dicoccoides TaxID=85692 RepID=UPI00189148BA|nr:uncharacterized protein LOC119316012 [Triticum dicoccoides]
METTGGGVLEDELGMGRRQEDGAAVHGGAARTGALGQGGRRHQVRWSWIEWEGLVGSALKNRVSGGKQGRWSGRIWIEEKWTKNTCTHPPPRLDLAKPNQIPLAAADLNPPAATAAPLPARLQYDGVGGLVRGRAEDSTLAEGRQRGGLPVSRHRLCQIEGVGIGAGGCVSAVGEVLCQPCRGGEHGGGGEGEGGVLAEELEKARERWGRLRDARQVTERVLAEADEAPRREMREWECRADEQRRVVAELMRLIGMPELSSREERKRKQGTASSDPPVNALLIGFLAYRVRSHWLQHY